MAIYHLSVKALSRSAGRSATAAAAYRAGCEIADERTGEIHDYTRKGGVDSADIVLPDGAPEWATDRVKLWNAAELAEKRKDACVAREFEVALPSEFSPVERRRLALDFAKDMANREGCAVDVALHAPGREGDNRNHHAHILRTTRKVEADGLGAKLDTEKAGRKRSDDLKAVRARWADITNERLRENGRAARIDHRSLEAQGINREPTQHLGPAASGYERRTGEPSQKRQDFERLVRAKAQSELERQSRQINRSINNLSGDLSAAKVELQERQAAEQHTLEEAAALVVNDSRLLSTEFLAFFRAVKEQAASELQAEQWIMETIQDWLQQTLVKAGYTDRPAAEPLAVVARQCYAPIMSRIAEREAQLQVEEAVQDAERQVRAAKAAEEDTARQAQEAAEAERKRLLLVDIDTLEKNRRQWVGELADLQQAKPLDAAALAAQWAGLAQAQTNQQRATQAFEDLQDAYVQWHGSAAGWFGLNRSGQRAWKARLQQAEAALNQTDQALETAQQQVEERLPAARQAVQQQVAKHQQRVMVLEQQINEGGELIAQVTQARFEAWGRGASPAPYPKPKYPAPGG